MVGEAAAQGDGEAAPQLGRPPLPHHIRVVVVAVAAQGLAGGVVGVVVDGHAPTGPAVRAQLTPVTGPGETAAAAGPAGLLRGVHQPERRGGEGGEHQRVRRHRLGDAFHAAGGAGHQHMPDVALVLMRARRAHCSPPVAAPHVGHPVRLGRRAVGGQHLARGRVDGVRAARQPHRMRAVPHLLDLAQPAAEVRPASRAVISVVSSPSGPASTVTPPHARPAAAQAGRSAV